MGLRRYRHSHLSEMSAEQGGGEQISIANVDVGS